MDTITAQRILEHKVRQEVFQVDPDALTALKIALIILIAFNNTLKEVSK